MTSEGSASAPRCALAARRRSSPERSTSASSMRRARSFWSADSKARASTRSPRWRARESRRSTPASATRGALHRRGDAGRCRHIARIQGRVADRCDDRGASRERGRRHPALGSGQRCARFDAAGDCGGAPVSRSGEQRLPDGARARSGSLWRGFWRETAQSDELGSLPAFAPERLATTTRFFLDLVVLPLVLRALFGEKLKQLRAEIDPHVARSVAFFLAACRHGGVT